MIDRIDFAVNFSALTDDALTYVEDISVELQDTAPRFFDALAWTCEHERRQRKAGLNEPVPFGIVGATLPEVEEAARAALLNAVRSAEFAKLQETQAAGDLVITVSKLFLDLHNGIVAAIGLDSLRAYRIAQLSPQTPAVN